MELNEQIKDIRLQRGYNKAKTAEKMGTSGYYYGSFEAGKNTPSLDMLKRMCQALDVTLTINSKGETTLI